MNKKTIFISFAVIVIAVGGFFANKIFSEDTSVLVKDEYNGRKLIEHFNFDTNELRLELIEKGNSRWIKHPSCCLTYKDHIPSNKIVFDHNNSNLLNVNGQSFSVQDEKQ